MCSKNAPNDAFRVEPIAMADVSSDHCAGVSHTPNASDLFPMDGHGRPCKCKKGAITWKSLGRCACFDGKLPTIEELDKDYDYDGDASTVGGSSCTSLPTLPAVFLDVEGWPNPAAFAASSQSEIDAKKVRPMRESQRKGHKRTVVPLPFSPSLRRQRDSENQNVTPLPRGNKKGPMSEIADLSTTEPSSVSDMESSDENEDEDDGLGFCYSFQSAELYAQPHLQQLFWAPAASCPVMQAPALAASEKVKAFFEGSAYILQMEAM